MTWALSDRQLVSVGVLNFTREGAFRLLEHAVVNGSTPCDLGRWFLLRSELH